MRSLFLIALIVTVLASCKKPEPEACFTSSGNLTEVGKSVNFTNCSVDAYSYEWDFGDGTSANDQNPSKIYNSPGNYQVRMTALSKNGKVADEMTQSITVGERYFSKAVVKSINWLDPNGGAWDTDGSGPDFQFLFGRNSQANYEWQTGEVSNVQQGQLPITINLGGNIKVTNEDWIFALYDVDLASKEEMSYGIENFATSQGSFVNFVGGGFDYEIHWEIK